MIRRRGAARPGLARVPRSRGDDPLLAYDPAQLLYVFPARAGMIRTPVLVASVWRSVPRSRGDDPELSDFLTTQDECSPLARG